MNASMKDDRMRMRSDVPLDNRYLRLLQHPSSLCLRRAWAWLWFSGAGAEASPSTPAQPPGSASGGSGTLAAPPPEALVDRFLPACEFLLLLALLLTAIRLVRGPSLSDRVLALDLLASLVVGFTLLQAARHQEPAYLLVALPIGLLAFIGTVAFARYATLAQESPSGGPGLRRGPP